MNPLTDFIALIGRILLAFLFVQGGYSKLFGGMAGTVATMTSHGIPFPNTLVWGAVVVELGIGLCLMAGLLARAAALVLAAYTLALGLLFHAYWLAPAAEARFDRIILFNHLSIIGGMLIVVAFGAGYYSLDALIQRRSERIPDAMRHAVAHL
jgi:putative oxidoreductase